MVFYYTTKLSNQNYSDQDFPLVFPFLWGHKDGKLWVNSPWGIEAKKCIKVSANTTNYVDVWSEKK